MIEKKTVLVLGAGASKPYGFPTGGELQDIIIDGCQREESDISRSLFNLQFTPAGIQEFGNQLLYAKRPSVDRFLEDRETFLHIGTAAIVSALIPKENPSLFRFREREGYKAEEDWYKYLWRQMDTSFEQFGENKLSIITYNYDRSLEFYLFTTLKHAYGKDDEECFRVLRKIPFIHLHGQLGTLFDGPADSNYRAYFPDTNYSDWKKVIPQIKIVHQVNPVKNPQFKQAQDLLEHAERICFLGFGYDNTNLDRLIGPIGPLGPGSLLGKLCFGTVWGFTQKEIEVLNQTRFLGNLDAGASRWGNLELLRQRGVLL